MGVGRKSGDIEGGEPGGRAVIRANVVSSTTPEGITETGSMTFDDSGRSRGTMHLRGHQSGREGKITVIADGTTSYASSDLFNSLPEGKKWIELDLSSATGRLSSPAPADAGPEEGLRTLEAVQGAEEVGEEEIDGVPTTHYVGTLPASKEVFGVKVQASAPQVEVWIDGQDRVRRIHVAVSTAVNGVEGSAATTEIDMDFVEFGRVPKIELPAPDEVLNVTGEFESNLQAAAAGH